MYQLPALSHMTSAYQGGRKVFSTRSEHVIGGLHSAIVELMSQPPLFLDVSRRLLARALEAEHQVSNPDVLFIASAHTGSGNMKPISLTRAFIRAICQGTDFLKQPSLNLHAHSGTWKSDHPVQRLRLEQVTALFERLIPKIWPTFESSVTDFWHAPVTLDGVVADQQAWTGTRRRLLARMTASLEFQELETAVSAGFLNEDDASRCKNAIGGASNTNGLYSIGLDLPGFGEQALVGSYVFSPNIAPASDSRGPLYLFELHQGWKKYDSVAALKQEVLGRLSVQDQREALSIGLSRNAADQLEQSYRDFSHAGIFLKPSLHGLPQDFLNTVLAKQRDDIAYEVAAVTGSDESIDLFLDELNAALALNDLQEGLLYRQSQLLTLSSEKSNPHWLRHAGEDDKQLYATLAESAYIADEYVAELLDSVGDRNAYASAKITDYMQAALGYSVDPARVSIKIVEHLPLNERPVKFEHDLSLLELTIEGMPDLERDAIVNVSLPQGYEHPDLNESFIRRMVKDLNIACRYGTAIEARHREPVFRNALTEVYAKGLALSALAAKLQGHISEKTYDLLAALQSPLILPANVIIGSVYLKQSNQRFEDPFVIKITGDDSRYILYAPGAPERDMYEFQGWRQLSMQVFEWLPKPGGAAYLHEQTSTNAGDGSALYLDQLQLKPSEWREDHLVFAEISPRTLKGALSAVADNKIGRLLYRNGVVSASRLSLAKPEHVQRLVTLDFRIRGLKKDLRGRSGVRPYADVAHQECCKLIRTHLQANGSGVDVDPDTVFFDLRQNPDPSKIPEFGPYSPLVSLTKLYMEGYSLEDYRFRSDALMYSTVGQDLSLLTPDFIDNMIRTSTLPDRYLKIVSGEKEMGLFVNKLRRSVFTRLLQYEVQRAATEYFMHGKLSPKQYGLIDALDDTSAQGMKDLRLVPLRIIENVSVFGNYLIYVEGNRDPELTLAYTPQAPDGIIFRLARDVIKSLHRADMRHYIYTRTESGKLGAMDRVLKHIQAFEPSQSTPYEVRREAISVTAPNDWDQSYIKHLKHIYADVSMMTETQRERVILGSYLFVREWGNRIVKAVPDKRIQLFWHLIHGVTDLMRAAYAYDAGNREKSRRLLISAAKEGIKVVRSARKINKQKKKDLAAKDSGKTRSMPQQPTLQALSSVA